MPRALWYIIGIVMVLVLVGTAGEISVRSATCMACHRQEANFTKWMSGRLKADQKGFAHELLGCADCHILGAPGKTVMSRLRGLLHIATYLVPQIDPRQERVAAAFRHWGVPTADSILEVRSGAPDLLVFASGGLRDGLDIAKSIALGARLGGMAGPFLKAAAVSTEETIGAVDEIRQELQICMFAAGAGSLEQLARTRLIRTE